MGVCHRSIPAYINNGSRSLDLRISAWLVRSRMANPIHYAGRSNSACRHHLLAACEQYNQVSIPSDPNSFHAGQLIGILERWLILVFILIGHYEVIGFLIAAKSIIRFGEKDHDKTEYFLAGTLLSIAIAVGCGLMVKSLIALN